MICHYCKTETGMNGGLVRENDQDVWVHIPVGLGCDIALSAIAGVFRDGVVPTIEKLEEIRKAILWAGRKR